MRTADICDQVADARVWAAPWRSFGGRAAIRGRVATVRVFEDAGLIRMALAEQGQGRVLVVDGGGSLRRAVLGDRMAALGACNGWAGVLIHGAVRDTEVLGSLDFGVFALGSVPARGRFEGTGDSGVNLAAEGLVVRPGDFATIDADGAVFTRDEVRRS
ncbi:ribonuclease E activity regulator RraA [Acidovorax sp. NCPPB 2350]|nr:ribonuclease E activity regulator RraA [Acidovorax sp. NCPPB 2350]